MTATVHSPERLDDHLVAAGLPVEALAIEPELATTKWFDYRFLHPVMATRIFADSYTEAYRAAWARHMDRDEAEHKDPLRDFGKKPAVFVGLWKARQAADRLGVPYNFFCRRSIRWAVDRNYKHIPRPNQLLSEEALASVREAWEELTGARLYRAETDHYLARSWCDHPAQHDHAEWLVTQARRRAHPEHILGEVVYQRPMVPEDFARAAFADREGLLESARMEASPPEELPPIGDLDFRLGCFGLPHGFSRDGAACAACPSAKECEQEQGTVMDEVITVTGSATPAEDRTRALARERKRRQRERAREKASVVGSTEAS